ncbi:MAG: hypothetical protein M2R45_03875 [Verrucomicrobia subdivision 3 bacterium]|nr:hypothetical protein [Limisphaerales bacterium]MCS1412579.1 hypothetical protein [Limisphaerales bacterium]
MGDVTAASVFGVGSITAALEATKTFTLTASRGNESVSADFKVSALDGVGDGWSLVDNFDAWPLGNINAQGLWKNPVGDAEGGGGSFVRFDNSEGFGVDVFSPLASEIALG